MAAQGGKALQSLKRKQRGVRIEDAYGYETVLRVVARALTAMVDEPGLPHVPDWPVGLAACAVLLECFPTYIRETPEQARELLDRMLPDVVRDPRLTPERAYVSLAKEKYRLRERGHPLAQFETVLKT